MFTPRLRGFSLVTPASSHSPNACIVGLGDLTGDSKVVGGVNVSVAGQMAFPSWVQQFQQPVRSVNVDGIDMELYVMLTSKKSSRWHCGQCWYCSYNRNTVLLNVVSLRLPIKKSLPVRLSDPAVTWTFDQCPVAVLFYIAIMAVLMLELFCSITPENQAPMLRC